MSTVVSREGQATAAILPLVGNKGDSPLKEGGQSLLFPLVLSWQEQERPLPVRLVRVPSLTRPRPMAEEAPPWHVSGPANVPFDFCGHIRRLCEDLVRRCPELAHIDVGRLLFGMTQARSGRRHGLQARVTPLRFQAGRLTRPGRGIDFQVQRYLVDQREMLYLITFCLPRFLDQEFDNKFVTLFHELYHISPKFDGDLRRHHGRYDLHSRSKKEYDRQMAGLAREYLATRPDPGLCGFLRLNFAQLLYRHGGVAAIAVPRPKVIPVSAAR